MCKFIGFEINVVFPRHETDDHYRDYCFRQRGKGIFRGTILSSYYNFSDISESLWGLYLPGEVYIYHSFPLDVSCCFLRCGRFPAAVVSFLLHTLSVHNGQKLYLLCCLFVSFNTIMMFVILPLFANLRSYNFAVSNGISQPGCRNAASSFRRHSALR